MTKLIQKFLKDEEGASAVEYAILVSLIAAAVATAVALFDLGTIFTTVSDQVIAIIEG